MWFVNVDDYYREAIAFLEGHKNGQPHEIDIGKAENILNEILNFNVGNSAVLNSLGALMESKGFHGLAIQILSQVTQMEPRNFSAWNNLGLAWKSVWDYERAERCLEKALKHSSPEHKSDAYCNLAAINLNRNSAEKALEYAKKSIETNPKNAKAHWHFSLAKLELRQWDEAWEGHEARLYGGAPKNQEIAFRNYHGAEITPRWEGQTPAKVVVHGEEGIGDEIMFSSCIPDILALGVEVIFEPSPRLEGLFRRSFPEAKVYGTHECHGERWINELGPPDYVIALGSLPKFFRTSAASFPGTPFLIPDPVRSAHWREQLNMLGNKKPNIGIAWQGGVAETRYEARSFHPDQYAPLFQAFDANWISLQYDQTAQDCVKDVKNKLGIQIHHWPSAVEQRDPVTGKNNANDMDEMAALVSQLDAVVTVCQTAVHLAGGLGVPTFCLTPSEPSWRYGAVEDESMPWYRSVHLLRQEKGTRDWKPVIERAECELRTLFSIMEAAQ